MISVHHRREVPYLFIYILTGKIQGPPPMTHSASRASHTMPFSRIMSSNTEVNDRHSYSNHKIDIVEKKTTKLSRLGCLKTHKIASAFWGLWNMRLPSLCVNPTGPISGVPVRLRGKNAAIDACIETDHMAQASTVFPWGRPRALSWRLTVA